MWKHYYTASSVDDALHLLSANAGHARLVAGGTDILIELERGIRKGIDTLIDVSRIVGLSDIVLDEAGQVRIGALVTHNDLVASPLIRERAFPLAQAAWEVGAPQIRNRGTLAGNLITASPANDTITPLWALGASVTLRSLDGQTSVALPDFYQGVRRTVLLPDQMLTHIHFPALQANQRGTFIKLGLRKAQAISVVNVAVILTFAGETVTDAQITLGSVAPTILRVLDAEQTLIGKALTEQSIREAARAAAAVPHPIDDVRSTAEYRAEMVKVLVARALRNLAANEERKSFPVAPPLLRTPFHSTAESAKQAANPAEAHPIETTINGAAYTLQSGHDKTLLRLLREDCALRGTKEGCAEGECGACTVFMDGAAVMACMVPAPRAHGATITTIEGLGADLHPVQREFIEAGAVQCGYCTPGFIMSGAKLLEEIAQPTHAQVQQSITGNLCRCTGYYKIIEAIQAAARERNSTTESMGEPA